VTYICFANRRDFRQWSDCDFSSANSICKHSCFILSSALISLTHFWEEESREEICTRWYCFEEINYFRDSWLAPRNDDPQSGFPCLQRCTR